TEVPTFFFFSCRRRHTRFSRDWSSDVCSSDLDQRVGDLAGRADQNWAAAADPHLLRKLPHRPAAVRIVHREGVDRRMNRVGADEIGRASCREMVDNCESSLEFIEQQYSVADRW